MSDYVTPTVESIMSEQDRGVLADHKSKLSVLGSTIASVETPSVEDVDALSLFASILDAIDVRDDELVEVERAVEVEATRVASLKDRFKVETPVEAQTPEAKVEKTLSFKLPESKVDVPVDTPVSTDLVDLDGNKFSIKEFGRKLADRNRSFASGKFVGTDREVLFSAKVTPSFGVTFGDSAADNYKAFHSLIAPLVNAQASGSDEALLASGGYCAPLNVSYDIPIYSEICATIESFLPTVVADRGGIKYMIPPADTTAAGIAVITCAEDKAGYTCETPAGTTPCKPTTKISCPTQAECCVDAITESITFGNFNYLTFPELIDWTMHQQAVNFSRVKQRYLLDKINDPANVLVKVAPAAQYDGVHDLMKALITLGAEYRNDNKMCYGSSALKLMIPRYIVDQFRFNAMAKELPDYGMAEAEVRGLLASAGFDVFFYEGNATGAPVVPALGTTTAVQALPVTGWAWIFHPESFTLMTNGRLDLGLVRDSTLNHANNLEFFAEEFIGVCRTGLKAVRFEFKFCANGTYAGPTAPFVCP